MMIIFKMIGARLKFHLWLTDITKLEHWFVFVLQPKHRPDSARILQFCICFPFFLSLVGTAIVKAVFPFFPVLLFIFLLPHCFLLPVVTGKENTKKKKKKPKRKRGGPFVFSVSADQQTIESTFPFGTWWIDTKSGLISFYTGNGELNSLWVRVELTDETGLAILSSSFHHSLEYIQI